MIREIATELETELRAVGVPFPVVNGPEPTTTTTWGRERIVVEYDPNGTDAFARPRTLSGNPKRRYVATEACKVTIYVQAAVTGAAVFEHRRRAKAVRDRVLVALELVCAKRDGDPNAFRPNAGAFVTPTDLEGAAIPGGAAYELRFGFPRAIEARKWNGDAQPTGTITTGAHTTIVRTLDDDAGELACGA